MKCPKCGTGMRWQNFSIPVSGYKCPRCGCEVRWFKMKYSFVKDNLSSLLEIGIMVFVFILFIIFVVFHPTLECFLIAIPCWFTSLLIAYQIYWEDIGNPRYWKKKGDLKWNALTVEKQVKKSVMKKTQMELIFIVRIVMYIGLLYG